MKLAGDLAEFSLPDLLQVRTGSRATAAIKILGPDGNGTIYLQDGRLVHADYEDLVGEDAFVALVAVTAGYFESAPPPADVPHSIDSSVSSLLMRAHELAANGSTPKPRRRRATGPVQIVAPADVPSSALSSGTRRRSLPRLLTWLVPVAATVAVAAAGAGWLIVRNEKASSSAGNSTTILQPAASVEASDLVLAGDRVPSFVSGRAPSPPADGLAVTPTIVCRLLVGRDGRVRDAKVYRSRVEFQAYEEAALAAVQDFRFEPGRRAGEPVDVWLNYPVTFQR